MAIDTRILVDLNYSSDLDLGGYSWELPDTRNLQFPGSMDIAIIDGERHADIFGEREPRIDSGFIAYCDDIKTVDWPQMVIGDWKQCYRLVRAGWFNEYERDCVACDGEPTEEGPGVVICQRCLGSGQVTTVRGPYALYELVEGDEEISIRWMHDQAVDAGKVLDEKGEAALVDYLYEVSGRLTFEQLGQLMAMFPLDFQSNIDAMREMVRNRIKFYLTD